MFKVFGPEWEFHVFGIGFKCQVNVGVSHLRRRSEGLSVVSHFVQERRDLLALSLSIYIPVYIYDDIDWRRFGLQ